VWFGGVTHREWIWLGASLLVALATVATLVAFGSYADGQARSLVRLEVSDTGVGISAEDQAHLFEKSFRSRERADTPGAGLGLAIAKAIIDAHHAAVGVRSIPGKGTTFCVGFPLAGKPVPGERRGGAGAAGGADAGPRRG
jgi:signal transduction histidine kinase